MFWVEYDFSEESYVTNPLSFHKVTSKDRKELRIFVSVYAFVLGQIKVEAFWTRTSLFLDSERFSG